MAEPLLSGEISTDGVLSVLQEIEHRRTTGVLEFEGEDTRGAVELVAGQIVVDQKELADGRDPVEALLELRQGRYRVMQRLPPLPVSKGDDLYRTGSLAVHVPADLMNYCEHAGMTGTLAFENGGRRAEVVYDGGDLIAIRVEGSGEDDLNEVFGWEEGTFEIQALSERPEVVPVPAESGDRPPEETDEAGEAAAAPAEAHLPEPKPRRKDETGQIFLRSVEVALSSIVDEREKRRSPTRTSPPLPPKPKARASDSFPGIEEAAKPEPEVARKRRGRPTVRVIYLGVKDATGGDEGVRHVRKDITAEVVLAEASPERRAATKDEAKEGPEGSPDADRSDGTDGGKPKDVLTPTSLLGTLAWVAVVFALMLVALGLLAQLPPME